MADLPANMPDWISQHIELYKTDPEAAHMWDSSMAGGKGVLPTLLLITKGRRSGVERPLPLIYKKVGDDYVIIASKGGAPAHPAWYLNIEAERNCKIQVAKDHFEVTARDAEGEERTKLWAELVEVYPPYNDYQKYAGDREIPVVVLEVKN